MISMPLNQAQKNGTLVIAAAPLTSFRAARYMVYKSDPQLLRAEASEEERFQAFLPYLAARWSTFAVTCGLAVLLAGAVSFLMPKKYTATESILIEPPASSDPHTATAVSPVYIESLKTYEHFADSDSLFEKALNDLQLRSAYAGTPIEVVKAQVLEVNKPRETKILEISAKLEDGQKALALVHYIADHIVSLNRAMTLDSVHEYIQDGEPILQRARRRVDSAIKARDLRILNEPIAGLEAELASASTLKAQVDRDTIETRMELAAYQARYEAGRGNGMQARDASDLISAIAANKAEIEGLNKQDQDLSKIIQDKSTLLEKRRQEQETMEKEIQTAQSQWEALKVRNSDMLESASSRQERLEILDPGVVPERPSSPNIPLNVVIALLASTAACLVYLLLAFNYSRRLYPSSFSGSD